jgi:hypothetical protein
MRLFLETDRDWFLRVIDNSWFNPDNLNTYIQQLSLFINPRRHIVIKGHLIPYYFESFQIPIMHGSTPILMSRAAVRHILGHFPKLCGTRHWSTDDLTLSLIVNRSFEAISDWDDVHFVGENPLNSTFGDQWNLHSSTHFRHFKTICSQKNRYLKPLKKIVGVHIADGNRAWREVIEMANENWFPEDLMLEYSQGKGYLFCLDRNEAVRLSSIKYLKKRTPRLEIDDEKLRFSKRELERWGFKTFLHSHGNQKGNMVQSFLDQ